MRKLSLFLMSLILGFSAMAHSSQTLVFVRHAEKPDNDSGQLTCKGLNRALALPSVLIKQFGQPDALFASAPKQNKLGSSLRAVQTISPLAIQVSLPIHLNFHAKEIKELQKELLSKQNENSLIFIAWEHDNLVKVVKNIMKQEGGDPELIPKWKGHDFDSIYVLTIDHHDTEKKITFEHKQQGLNNLADSCPN